jgi:hypothetical protein
LIYFSYIPFSKFVSLLARFQCVAMSRHICVILAAKGVSSSSVKAEDIAVQYWTRSERRLMGLARLFGYPDYFSTRRCFYTSGSREAVSWSLAARVLRGRVQDHEVKIYLYRILVTWRGCDCQDSLGRAKHGVIAPKQYTIAS